MTLIDNVFLKSDVYDTHQSKILIDNISDHYPSILLLEDLQLTKTVPQRIKTRKIGCKEINEIKSRLSTIDWMSKLTDLNTNEAFNTFHDKLRKIIDVVAPEKIRTKIVKKHTVPWYSTGLKNSEWDKCLYKLANTPTASVEQKTKNQDYHSELRRIKRKAKQMYYRNLCSEFRHNSAKLWKLINSISGKTNNKNDLIEHLTIDNVQHEHKSEIVEIFARHFSSVGKKYADRIAPPNKNIEKYLSDIPSSNHNIFLDATTPSEIHKLIRTLPNKRSSGYDNVNNILLKDLSSELLIPLSIIFNKSLCEGTFPDKMKLADTVPLHKSKDRCVVDNY